MYIDKRRWIGACMSCYKSWCRKCSFKKILREKLNTSLFFAEDPKNYSRLVDPKLKLNAIQVSETGEKKFEEKSCGNENYLFSHQYSTKPEIFNATKSRAPTIGFNVPHTESSPCCFKFHRVLPQFKQKLTVVLK